MGTLYIVATPIGNLQDITLRSLNTLRDVDFIACEDTRVASILIRHYFKENPKIIFDKLFSYFEQNEIVKINKVLNLLNNDKNVALISDAGTPTISDPGFKLVREAHLQKINVVSIPGPSSVISSLASSGLPTDKFTFLGFLPIKPGHRITLLQKLKKSLKIVSTTVIIFESPYKILKTLQDIESVFGNIDIVMTRELTKIHEEIKKDKIQNFVNYINKKPLKGEITILFNLK
jgi:16S rRNA (cytidine1402-2'-O)-methyltransferase